MMANRAWGLEAMGEPARAVESMREAVASSEGDAVMRMGLVRALCLAGERGAALALLAQVEDWREGRRLLAYERALAWLALGDGEQAIDLLEQASQDHSGWMAYLAIDPRLDPLRTEARFEALVERITLESRSGT